MRIWFSLNWFFQDHLGEHDFFLGDSFRKTNSHCNCNLEFKILPNSKISLQWLKKTLWPLHMDGIELPQGHSHFEEAIYFIPLSSQKFLLWVLSSFYRPRKDERLSPPWRHQVVLSTGPLDWESSAFFFFLFFFITSSTQT